METDNKGAHDVCHRFSSAQHTRHIDRKLFKLREMRGAGLVTVKCACYCYSWALAGPCSPLAAACVARRLYGIHLSHSQEVTSLLSPSDADSK